MNTYGYVGGNPLLFTDPYGLFLCELLSFLGDSNIFLNAGVGAGFGIEGGLKLSSSGIEGTVTSGSGIGLGASAGLTGSVNLTPQTSSASVGTNVSVSGGAGIGGNVGVSAGTGGVSLNGSAGVGIGLNVVVGLEVKGPIIKCEENELDCSK